MKSSLISLKLLNYFVCVLLLIGSFGSQAIESDSILLFGLGHKTDNTLWGSHIAAQVVGPRAAIVPAWALKHGNFDKYVQQILVYEYSTTTKP